MIDTGNPKYKTKCTLFQRCYDPWRHFDCFEGYDFDPSTHSKNCLVTEEQLIQRNVEAKLNKFLGDKR